MASTSDQRENGQGELSGLERIWKRPSPAYRRKALAALIAGALFYLLALGFVIGSRLPALDIRVGDIARRDYVSRVEFETVDVERTQRARDLKEKEVPSVYDKDLSGLRILGANLTGLLVQLAGRGEVQPTESLEQWKLSNQELEAMVRSLRGSDAADLTRAVNRVVNWISARGVIQPERLDVEKESGRDRILVGESGREPRQDVPLSQLIDTASALQDIRAKAVNDAFAGYSFELQDSVARVVAARLEPTLTYNEELTRRARERARQEQPAFFRTVRRGEPLLRLGKQATASTVHVLEQENRLYWAAQPLGWRLSRIAGAGLILVLLLGVWWPYVGRLRREPTLSLSRIVAFGSLMLLFVVGARLLDSFGLVYLLPISAVAIVLCITFSAQLAIAVTILLALVTGVSLGLDFRPVIVLLSGGVAAVWGSTRLRNRARLIRLGAVIGLVQAAAVWGTWMLSPSHGFAWSLSMPAIRESALAAVSGVAVGLIISGALSLIERAFNVTTDVSLLALSDQYQPLLRRLLLEAPGTYHHSFVVAALAEGAAEAIGANALLARVGAYYHDIGKLYKPEYFVENETPGGPSVADRHNQLTPAISALIIIGHAKEGVRMAEVYGMPRIIVDLIKQHHGTSLVEYFYHEAAARKAQAEPLEEGSFRYPGPKPRTKEAAIVSLADALEAASRTMSEPTPGRIMGLIDDIVARRLGDGQLGECDLTLKDLHEVKKSFGRILFAIFHGRIKYPELQRAEARQGKRHFVSTARNPSNPRHNRAQDSNH